MFPLKGNVTEQKERVRHVERQKVSYLFDLVGNVGKRSHVADVGDWQQRASLTAFLFHRKFLKTPPIFLLRILELVFKIFDTGEHPKEK